MGRKSVSFCTPLCFSGIRVKHLFLMVGPWGLEPQTSTVSMARIGITITYKTAGTAKVRGSHTRHTFCGLGCGLKYSRQKHPSTLLYHEISQPGQSFQA